ncbi:MAG TPA: hypothetical protein VHE30_01495 [Polyangiaceae bacterium]|nr:hypothetical protein [Polyangiaceae bacterium]
MSFEDDVQDLSDEQLDRLERLPASPRARLERALHVLDGEALADLAAHAEALAEVRLRAVRRFDAGTSPPPTGRPVGVERGRP